MTGSDITVKQYYAIMDVLQNEADPIAVQESLIKIIFGLEMADIPIPKIKYYVGELDFLKQKYKEKPAKKKYCVGKEVFCPILDLSTVTTAQYIDFQELLKRKDGKNLLDCLFIREGEKYGDTKGADFLGENLPMSDYSDVMFFFLHLLNRLTINTLSYSEKEMMRLLKKTKQKEKRIPLLRKMIQVRLAIRSLESEDESIG